MVVRLAWLWVVTVRLLFNITFPLNNFGGDTSNYYAMLRDGTSSLVHAAGYPFLMGLPFRPAFAQRLFADALDVQSYVIFAAQHLIDLAALLVLFKVVSAVYGRTTAALALLLAGTSLQNLGTTSSAYPEWLQAALLVFALAAAYWPYTRPVFATKICLYMLASWLFTFCVLVKFNAAVLAFAFIAIVALEPLSLAKRALT